MESGRVCWKMSGPRKSEYAHNVFYGVWSLWMMRVILPMAEFSTPRAPAGRIGMCDGSISAQVKTRELSLAGSSLT